MSSRIDNPLREGVRLERTADPCTVIIFGASGDLTKRKLVPALYRLTQERLLPAEFAIVGFARSPMSHDDFRAKMKDAIVTYSEAKRVDEAVWDSFAKGIFYVSGDVNNPEAYQKISKLLDQIVGWWTPPVMFHRVQVGRINRSSVFAPETFGNLLLG